MNQLRTNRCRLEPGPGRATAGLTLIELLVTLFIVTLLFAGLNSVVTGLLGSQTYLDERIALTRDAEFALNRIVRAVSHSRRLLLPLNDKALSDWPENIREQTVPPSPPIGSSTLATAVLAVTLPEYVDIDFNGIPDADNDRDGLIDEDPGGDQSDDGASGIYGIDDGGDGSVDEFDVRDDDEYFNDADDDPENGIDDDNDNNVDEDPPADKNGDGCPGICGVDDDEDGNVDEGNANDDDEDGRTNEDGIEALVFYLEGDELKERVPYPFDLNFDFKVDGRDFIAFTIAENVSRIRFERLPNAAGLPQLVDITLELSTTAAGTVSVNTRVRVGGAL
ncbi:MAG: prepilin-type N-terminal cleavage/methylation domain-containing protein [Gammaproteobacteria bacterium]